MLLPCVVFWLVLGGMWQGMNAWKGLEALKQPKFLKNAILSIVAASSLASPLASLALDVQYKLPPIDFKDPDRCQLVSSSMGQANAARDKLYDLRQCTLTGLSASHLTAWQTVILSWISL